MPDPRAALPKVSVVCDRVTEAGATVREEVVTRLAREAVAAVRDELDGDAPVDAASLEDRVVDRARARLAELTAPAGAAINATGVVLHTGLGRAPLSAPARQAMAAAAGAHAVELDPAGRRGHRDRGLADLVQVLTGAQDATFANNGAGALVLALRAAAGGGRVAVSRGELIEIGGSFRLPDVVGAAGVGLHEIGTTNRTHLHDVEAAVDEGVDAVLVVHPSNYRVDGFVARPEPRDVAAVCRRAGIPLVHDVGSGLLGPSSLAVLADEPDVATSLSSGAALVTGSGDKLLGGPQAGLLVGDRGLVARARRDPLARALRLDKLRVAALRATLQQLLADTAAPRLPVTTMLTADVADVRDRATALARSLGEAGIAAAVAETSSLVGGGAVPERRVPSVAVTLPAAWAQPLRDRTPPVLGRVRDDRVWLDLRTVPPADDDELRRAIEAVAHEEDDDRGRPS